LNNRGILKGKSGQISTAIADFEQAIRLKPDYAEAWYNRGIAYFQAGEPEHACADWKESARLGFAPARQAIVKYCTVEKTPGQLQMPGIEDESRTIPGTRDN
jgi:Flp pilus assembly protein TadD